MTVMIVPGLSASAAATNNGAATLSCVSDPSLRVMANFTSVTKVRFLGRLGGTVHSSTVIRIQYHTGGNPAVAIGDAGWTTLAESAGSHTAGTMFYTAEAAIPAEAQINPLLVRACIYGGDGAKDPTITSAILNLYP